MKLKERLKETQDTLLQSNETCKAEGQTFKFCHKEHDCDTWQNENGVSV